MSENLDFVQFVAFDAVGTLIRPDPPVMTAYADIGRSFGSTRSEIEILSRYQTAVRQQDELDRNTHKGKTSEQREKERWQAIVAGVFSDVRDQAGLFKALWDHFSDPRHWPLFEDAEETWIKLQESQVPLGVASNFDKRLERICRWHEPLATCKDLFISSVLGWRKPSREFFSAIEQRLSLKPKRLLLVGDDWDNDFQAAKGAGWHALHLSRDASSQGSNHDTIHSLLDVVGRLGYA